MRLISERGFAGRWVVVIVAAGTLAVAATGWLVWSEIRSLHEDVSRLSSDVQTARQRADQAEARADRAEQQAAEAGDRAEQAEASARESALGRMRAEAAREAAEMVSDEAQADAVSARQDAESARQQTAAAVEEAEAARQELEELRRRRQLELDHMQEALNRIVETRRTAIGMVMSLDADRIEFDFDRAELRPANRELLSRIAGVLLTGHDYRIQVFGHTDEIGTEQYNQQLSERRARAVADYLVEAGIDAEIMAVEGLGESKPLVDGSDPESRQRNRRVEIGVIDTMVEYRGTAQERGGAAAKKKIKR